MRIFISQPMRNKTQKTIETRRNKIIKAIKERYLNEHIDFVDSFADEGEKEFWKKNNIDLGNEPVWSLGKSIEKLATATLAYFDEGWENARGCRIEHRICEDYGISTLHYDNLFVNEKE